MCFPNQTNLVDIEGKVPTIRPTDSSAGRLIGIRFLSTVNPALAGGYWVLDNVRIAESIDIPNGSFESPGTVMPAQADQVLQSVLRLLQ